MKSGRHVHEAVEQNQSYKLDALAVRRSLQKLVSERQKCLHECKLFFVPEIHTKSHFWMICGKANLNHVIHVKSFRKNQMIT